MHELGRLALVGTANVSADAQTVPAIDEAIPDGSREARLLWQAGAWAVYQGAGYQPPELTAPGPAPSDACATAPLSVHSLLAGMLAGEWEELQDWTVARLAQNQLRLPHGLLPMALGLSVTERRHRWQPLLGERGRWLADLSPDWHWALDESAIGVSESDLNTTWQEGTFAARQQALAEMRRRDPARAREWLVAALPQEKAEQRLAFASVLSVQLHDDDEGVLAGLLADRSQSVRQLAAGLLCQLPSSALAGRLQDRATDCFRWQQADRPQGALAKVVNWLGKGSSPTVNIEPPHEVDKTWERDGLQATPPAGEGKRAFWLRHLLALIPPATWSNQAEAAPAQLIAAAEADEWAEAALRGLAQATVRFADQEWATALLQVDTTTSKWLDGELRTALWQVLPADERAALCTTQFADGRVERCLQGLLSLPAPWPAVLAEAVRQALDPARYTLSSVDAFGIPLDLLARALLCCSDDAFTAFSQQAIQWQDVVTTFDAWAYWQPKRKAERLVALAQARQILIKEIPL